jgi:hypothetical protein
MKTGLKLIKGAMFLILFSTLNSQLSTFAQGTAFMYQGHLNDGGAPANGNYDLQFALYDAASGGTQQGSTLAIAPTAASNGLFTVMLDFGNQFNGAARWLAIGVRTNGSVSAYTVLTPREQLTPTPYAITAGNVSGSVPAGQLSGLVPSANLAGTYSGALNLNNASDSFTGDGSGLLNVNAGLLGGLSASQFWKLAGNGGTTPGVNFVGTTDNQPLELDAGSQRALRLEPNTSSGAPNFIAGSYGNYVLPSTIGAAIGGGGATAYAFTEPVLGGIFPHHVTSNQVYSNFGTIGGGGNNLIQSNSVLATIGGGFMNLIQTNSRYSVIVGGLANTVQTNGPFSVIGGGVSNAVSGTGSFIGGGGYDGGFVGVYGNTIQANASVISGGLDNWILSGSDYSTIAGGVNNWLGYHGAFEGDGVCASIGGGEQNTNDAFCATIPGGFGNYANGSYSFAAGQRASALHQGTFVWADDSSTTPFASTGNNQFDVRAAGGVLFTSGSGAANNTVSWTPGSASWSFTSDRNAKENFSRLNVQEVLEKVTQLPLTEWNYKGYASRHIGPMAQDFHAAFPLNPDDKMLNSADENGVALAAIQGLNQKVEEKEARIQQQASEIADLKMRLDKLEQIINTKNGGDK